MHAAKTGALLSCASSIGAVLAGGDEDTVSRLAAFGIQVGIAFQAVDDQLGIWGQPELTGKPTWNDLRQRKSSLPVVAALDMQCDEADRLGELLSKLDLVRGRDRRGGRAGRAVRRPALRGRGGRAAARAGAARARARDHRSHRARGARGARPLHRREGVLTTTASAPPVQATLDRAVDHLLSLQSPEGWWKGELETNVTMDAEDLLLRQFLGIRTEEQTEMSARWIRSKQREDGTWGNFWGAPADLSTTVESYAALKLAGDPVDAEHMRARTRVHPRRGRPRADARLHKDLVLAVRAVVVGRRPGDAAGDDAAPSVRPAQHLRLRVLGAADGRGADGRLRVQADPARALHPRRAADGDAAGAVRAARVLARCVPAAGHAAARLRAAALVCASAARR